MSRTNRLLVRLREGPLFLADFAEVSASVGALKVSVHKLRAQGFKIRTEGGGKAGPGAYFLTGEPKKCPISSPSEKA